MKSIVGFCIQLQNLKSFLQKVNLDLPINCNKTVIVLVTCIEDPYAFNPTVAYYRRVEKLFWLLILRRHKRPSDSRTRTTASTRIDLKVFSRILINVDFPRTSFYHCPLERFALLSKFIVKEVTCSFDRKMIKLLTFDMNLVFATTTLVLKLGVE